MLIVTDVGRAIIANHTVGGKGGAIPSLSQIDNLSILDMFYLAALSR
jgi:hypothetical protein